MTAEKPIKPCAPPLRTSLQFSYPEDGVHYDVLLIIRGCTGCPYLYEDIDADRRVLHGARRTASRRPLRQIRQLA